MARNRKAKHDPRKRLRATLRGSRIIFDGNDRQELDYRQSNGLPMTRDMLDVATGWSWRWRIALGLRCRFGEMTRHPSTEIIVNQSCCINDLTEYVKEQHEIMALEQPSSWKIEAQTWEVEIIG
jgi:hypothetical protein